MDISPGGLLRAAFGVTDLRRLIGNNYFRQRIGMAVLALALPLLLAFGGMFLGESFIRSSMSDYYHAEDHILRDIFVGTLCTVGVFLLLYRGFTWLEDVALSAAGLAAIVVALVPSGTSPLHGIAAIAFFVCFGYVVLFRSEDTLTKELMTDVTHRERWVQTYKVFGTALVLVVVAAAALTWFTKREQLTFMVEAASVSMFGLYWIIKTSEIERSLAGSTRKRDRITTKGYSRENLWRPVEVIPAQEGVTTAV